MKETTTEPPVAGRSPLSFALLLITAASCVLRQTGRRLLGEGFEDELPGLAVQRDDGRRIHHQVLQVRGLEHSNHTTAIRGLPRADHGPDGTGADAPGLR